MLNVVANSTIQCDQIHDAWCTKRQTSKKPAALDHHKSWQSGQTQSQQPSSRREQHLALLNTLLAKAIRLAPARRPWKRQPDLEATTSTNHECHSPSSLDKQVKAGVGYSRLSHEIVTKPITMPNNHNRGQANQCSTERQSRVTVNPTRSLPPIDTHHR